MRKPKKLKPFIILFNKKSGIYFRNHFLKKG